MERQSMGSYLFPASQRDPGPNLPALLCAAMHQNEETQTLHLGSPSQTLHQGHHSTVIWSFWIQSLLHDCNIEYIVLKEHS